MALTSPDADIKVLCSRDVVGISAKEDFFRYYNVSLELLYLPSATCLAVKTTINNATYYDLRIPKEKYAACGGKLLEVDAPTLRLRGLIELAFRLSAAEKLDSHHLLAQPRDGARGRQEYHPGPGDQTGLQMCLSIRPQSQPAVFNHPVRAVSETLILSTSC